MPKASRDAGDEPGGDRVTYDGHLDLGPDHTATPDWVDAGRALDAGVLDAGVLDGGEKAAAERAAARPEVNTHAEEVEPVVPAKDTIDDGAASREHAAVRVEGETSKPVARRRERTGRS